MSKRQAAPSNCPCGRALAYADCCARHIEGGATAPDAETLMRSRYTAYVLDREDYLLATWHPSTRPNKLALEEPVRPKWLGLRVLRHAVEDAEHASVEFIARYKIAGRARRMHEISRFVREDGRWYYLDGTQQAP